MSPISEFDEPGIATWNENIDELKEYTKVHTLNTRHWQYRLWKQARTEPESLFRDHEGFKVLDVDQERYSGILIRDDYKWALQDTIALHNSDKQPAPYETERGTLNIDVSTISVGNLLTVPNRAMVVVGHPGIGKSVWLILALVKCLIAGRTVVTQDNPHYMFIYNGCGVFRIETPPSHTELNDCLPRSAWFLIDTNKKLETVPEIVTDTGLFIVQASSPRMRHLDWRSKSGYFMFTWIMKPITREELEAACSLQKKPPVPNDAVPSVMEFFDKFGPSARDAYASLSTTACMQYERELNGKFKKLQFAEFKAMLDENTTLSLTDDTISHQILIITPGITRFDISVDFVSQHVFNVFNNHFLAKHRTEASKLFSLFLSTPETRTPAGHILEAAFHAAIPAGGKWGVVSLTRSEENRNIIWKTGDAVGGERTCLVVQDKPNPVARILANYGEPIGSHHLKVEDYPSGASFALQHAYYRPSSKREPTIDAFLYDSGHDVITAFQVTVAESLDVNCSGLKWLFGLRGEKKNKPLIDFVVVTPNRNISLTFTPDGDRLVRSKYFLQFSHLPRLPEFEV